MQFVHKVKVADVHAFPLLPFYCCFGGKRRNAVRRWEESSLFLADRLPWFEGGKVKSCCWPFDYVKKKETWVVVFLVVSGSEKGIALAVSSSHVASLWSLLRGSLILIVGWVIGDWIGSLISHNKPVKLNPHCVVVLYFVHFLIFISASFKSISIQIFARKFNPVRVLHF